MSDRYTVTGLNGDGPGAERVRSEYVEEHWLPYVGPTALLLARRLDNRLASEARVAVEVRRWSIHLCVTEAELIDAFHRLVRYGVAEWGEGENHLRLNRHWPPVPAAIATDPHRAALVSLDDR